MRHLQAAPLPRHTMPVGIDLIREGIETLVVDMRINNFVNSVGIDLIREGIETAMRFFASVKSALSRN